MSKYFQKGKSWLNWQYPGHQIKYLLFPAAHSNMMWLTLICALNMCTNTLHTWHCSPQHSEVQNIHTRVLKGTDHSGLYRTLREAVNLALYPP